MRSLFIVLLVAGFTALVGCASVPGPPPEGLEAKFGNIAIVPARYVPSTEFVTFARGPVAGSAKGAGAMASVPLAWGMEDTHNPYNPLVGLVASILLLPVTVPLGVAAGLTNYTSEETAQQIEMLIDIAVKKENMPLQLGRQVANSTVHLPWVSNRLVLDVGPENFESTSSYTSLSGEGIDTVLEIGILRAGFETCGTGNKHMRLYMVAEARLVRVRDNTVLASQEFRFDSPERPIASWTLQRGSPLANAFNAGYRKIANRIVESMLDHPTYWPFRAMVTRNYGKSNEGYCWLKPLNPECEYATAKHKATFFGLQPLATAQLKFTYVESLYPELKWESFPRPIDISADNDAELSRIGQVSYDLKIWEWNGKEKGALVYDRIQLPEPQHRVEIPLRPYTKYLWSFRARYEYSGQLLVTGWSFSYLPRSARLSDRMVYVDCSMETIPASNYYRFRTPGS